MGAFIAGISGQENIDALNRRKPRMEKEITDIEAQLATATAENDEKVIIELTSKLEDMKIDHNLLESEMKEMHERFQREHVETQKALEIYTMLRKLDSVRLMSQGNAGLYVTPQDVNLTVGQLFLQPRAFLVVPTPLASTEQVCNKAVVNDSSVHARCASHREVGHWSWTRPHAVACTVTTSQSPIPRRRPMRRLCAEQGTFNHTLAALMYAAQLAP